MGLSVSVSQVEDLFVNKGYPVMLERYNAVPFYADSFADVTTAPYESLASQYADFPYGYTHGQVLGMEQPREIEHGQEAPADTLIDGYNPQFKVRKFARSITFTEEDFTKRNAMAEIGDKLSMVSESWGPAFINWENALLADFLQKGTLAAGHAATFKNRYQGRTSVTDGLIYDGKAWFADDHPQDDGSGTTYDNLLGTSNALSTTTLQDAVIRASVTNAYDGRGNRIMIMPDVLVVPPGLQWTAKSILESDRVAETANNGINTVRGIMQLVVNPFLTDSSTAWWVGTRQPGLGLKVIRTGAPRVRVIANENDMTITVQAVSYLGAGVVNWRGWVSANKASS